MSPGKRRWTPAEADEWTREDTIAVILSPIVYLCLLVGVALSLFLVPAGFVALAAGVVGLVALVRLIDPKLTAVSDAYEHRQKEYIEELERKVRWED